jgi:hypothetical protein
LIRDFVALDSHINESDLIRDSIREKIQRDAPQLYSKLLAEAMEKGQKQREKQGTGDSGGSPA